MGYETILVKKSSNSIIITFNRLNNRNSINADFLNELNDVLNNIEKDLECKIVILEGKEGIFCTGMDFEEFDEIKNGLQLESTKDIKSESSFSYMETIKRFTLMPKVIMAKVDGQVMAGGVGIVAASDLVIATPRSQFSLSEALWGLLPAMVIPFLIRRVGYQKAYSMTLTTLPVSAQEAYEIHLVDKITETPDDVIRNLLLRLGRLDESTIGNMKEYFRKMWIITDQMEEQAVSEISRLISQPRVKENIINYVKFQQFPWEKDRIK